MISATTRNTIAAFLALPYEALPAARFANDDDAWASDPWAVLREAVRLDESVTWLCGTSIILSADRPAWRRVEVV